MMKTNFVFIVLTHFIHFVTVTIREIVIKKNVNYSEKLEVYAPIMRNATEYARIMKNGNYAIA